MDYNHDVGALSIHGLGPPQIRLNDRQVAIKRRKAVALLVYLAVEGRSQSREFLSGLFWPEYDQASAYAYLRRSLWEINHVLGEGWLEISREWVGLSSSMELQMDVNQFQALLAGVREHDHPRSEPCGQCLDMLESAVGMYGGDFLAGFSLSACPQFDGWQFLQSELLRRMYRDALQDLTVALEQSGRVREAIPYAQKWLAVDNLDERAHRKLMVLYAENGQMHSALCQFEECQAVLKRELELTPEKETLDLFNQIREMRSSSSSGEAGQTQVLISKGDQTSWLEKILSAPVRIAFQTYLPVQATPFIGREVEVGEISGLLYKPGCWLLTLTGLGGVGKTRLANQVGQEISASFPDGVYFVSMEGVESISALLPKIADTLSPTFNPHEGSLEAQLMSFLRDKTLLMIFDNFDALIPEADLLHQLHAEAANVKFLATSRERLKISGEWVFEVQGLEYPEWDPGKMDEILRYPAVSLFLLAAQRTSSQFQIDEGNYQDIIAIVQLMEGMPLGLEMAASWVHLLTPKEILAEIRSNLDFLRTEMRDTPVRQRSMRAVLDHSWRRLSRDDQAALARLSVFPGGFNRESAEKAAAVSLADLKMFMDRSLIYQKGSGEFRLHELMRQYALKKLRQSPGDYRKARDRHATYYVIAVSHWGEGLKGPEQAELLPLMRREADNIQTAWDWVTQSSQIEMMKRGLEGLCYFYLRTLRNQEGLQACQVGLAALEGAETEYSPQIHADLLAWKSIFSLSLDDHETASVSIDHALELMGETDGEGDDSTLRWARLFLVKAVVENYLDNRALAFEYYERAFEIYRQRQDFSGFSYLMLRAIDIGGVTSEKIYQYLSEAVHFKRKSGDLFDTAYLLYVYSLVVGYHFGDSAQAEALMQEGCQILEKLGDVLSKEMSLVAVDPILNINGRYEELLEVREKRIAFARQRGDRQTLGIYLSEIAETHCHLGDYPAAEDHFREALLHLSGGTPYQRAFRLCGLGEALLVQGKISAGREILKESAAGMKTGEKWGLGRALGCLSAAACKMGDRDKAWEIIRQALGYHYEAHSHYFTHFSLGAYAYLLSQTGEAIRGIEIYAMLARQGFVCNSHWFDELYRKPIYALAAEISPAEVQKAEASGKEMDLWETLEQIIQQW